MLISCWFYANFMLIGRQLSFECWHGLGRPCWCYFHVAGTNFAMILLQMLTTYWGFMLIFMLMTGVLAIKLESLVWILLSKLLQWDLPMIWISDLMKHCFTCTSIQLVSMSSHYVFSFISLRVAARPDGSKVIQFNMVQHGTCSIQHGNPLFQSAGCLSYNNQTDSKVEFKYWLT